MQNERILRTRKRLTTPRAAAVAGIIFALLFGTSLFLIRWSVPAGIARSSELASAQRSTVALALNLIPYAGIAFLWFIGVTRDRVGDTEDRLFGTVFLGSGLLFLAMIFVSGALAGGMVSELSNSPSGEVPTGIYQYGRSVMYLVLNVYAIRMAGVFMISLATIWLRTGLMHRGWAFATYALALVLLFSISVTGWVILLFPAWVFAVSIYYLVTSLRNPARSAENPV
jgi:hypothetical protein